jgi:hypothetical protein
MSTTETDNCIAQYLRLNKLQIKNLFAALQPSPDEWPEEFKTRLLVLANLLERLAYLKPEARTAILRGVWASVNRMPDDKLLPMTSVYFADGAYCCWAAAEAWLDLQTGEMVAQLPAKPAETISYNLDVLEQQLKQKCV